MQPACAHPGRDRSPAAHAAAPAGSGPAARRRRARAARRRPPGSWRRTGSGARRSGPARPGWCARSGRRTARARRRCWSSRSARTAGRARAAGTARCGTRSTPAARGMTAPTARASPSSSSREEDVVGDGRDDGVVALRLRCRDEVARIVPGPERAGDARAQDEPRSRSREPTRRPVDEHVSPAGLDPLAQPLEERLPRPPRIAEQLGPRLLAPDLPAQRQLAPQPRHRDVLRAVAELPAQQRSPDLHPRLPAHRALDPGARRLALERRDVLSPAAAATAPRAPSAPARPATAA